MKALAHIQIYTYNTNTAIQIALALYTRKTDVTKKIRNQRVEVENEKGMKPLANW